MYVCLYVCMYVCMYVRRHVCIYIYIYIYICAFWANRPEHSLLESQFLPAINGWKHRVCVRNCQVDIGIWHEDWVWSSPAHQRIPVAKGRLRVLRHVPPIDRVDRITRLTPGTPTARLLVGEQNPAVLREMLTSFQTQRFDVLKCFEQDAFVKLHGSFPFPHQKFEQKIVPCHFFSYIQAYIQCVCVCAFSLQSIRTPKTIPKYLFDATSDAFFLIYKCKNINVWSVDIAFHLPREIGLW